MLSPYRVTPDSCGASSIGGYSSETKGSPSSKGTEREEAHEDCKACGYRTRLPARGHARGRRPLQAVTQHS